jgi:protease-4
MSVEAIEKIAEGRVWTGTAAKELGLVDELGGLDKAIEIAAQKSGIEAYSIIHHPNQESFFDSLMEPIKEDYIQGQMAETMGEYYEYVKFIQNVQNMDRIQARMPFDLRIR